MSLLAFAKVVDLFEQLEELETVKFLFPADTKAQKARRIVVDWFDLHIKKQQHSDKTNIALLSTLLPQQRSDRVYGLGTKRLGPLLARCLCLGTQRASLLIKWSPADGETFAALAGRLHAQTESGTLTVSPVLDEVDDALHGLAARFHFSSPQIKATVSTSSSKTPEEILAGLLQHMKATELKWFVRLILKDLSPIALDRDTVLTAFHPSMPGVMRIRSDFSAAISILHLLEEASANGALDPRLTAGILGLPGEMIPPQEFAKARSIKHCLQLMDGGKGSWSIQTKYDGEYCQVHVDLTKGNDRCYQIFSKSCKDSSEDKRGVHPFLRECLRIGQPDCGFARNCILEGELLVYNRDTNKILPFHKIRQHVARSGRYLGTAFDGPIARNEKLMIMFFDILSLDNHSLLTQNYATRRSKMRAVVRPVGTLIPRSKTNIFDFDKVSVSRHTRIINHELVEAISGRLEGLVIKSCAPTRVLVQNCRLQIRHARIIKLKKDLIPGLGDAADFAVIGATLDNRGQNSSRLDGKKVRWTHFTLAVLLDKGQLGPLINTAKGKDCSTATAYPTFRAIAVISRPCISERDMLDIAQSGQCLEERFEGSAINVPYKISFITGVPSPTVLFRKPFIVEVVGSSFEKPSNSDFYMLRHPRIVKLHRDRSIDEVTSFEELQTMARLALDLPDDLHMEEVHWMNQLRKIARHKRYHVPSCTPSDSLDSGRGLARCLSTPVTPERPKHTSSELPQPVSPTAHGQKRKARCTSSDITGSERVSLPNHTNQLDQENAVAPLFRTSFDLATTRRIGSSGQLSDITSWAQESSNRQWEHQILEPDGQNNRRLLDMAPFPTPSSLQPLDNLSLGWEDTTSLVPFATSPWGSINPIEYMLTALDCRNTQGSVRDCTFNFPRQLAERLLAKTVGDYDEPFEDCIVFLEPNQPHGGNGIIAQMRARDILTTILLPKLGVSQHDGTLIEDIHHWQRAVNNDLIDPSSLGESQAYRGLRKVVLTGRRNLHGLRMQFGRLRLVQGEVIEFWDLPVVFQLIRLRQKFSDSTITTNKSQDLIRNALIGRMHRQADGVNIWERINWELMLPNE